MTWWGWGILLGLLGISHYFGFLVGRAYERMKIGRAILGHEKTMGIIVLPSTRKLDT